MKVICESENYKDELVTDCITKFCEMVRHWDLLKTHQFFILLVKNLENKKSSIASLRLLRSLIKDHKETIDASSVSAETAYSMGSYLTGTYPPAEKTQ